MRDTVWFPVVLFVGIAVVLFVTVQVSHDHLGAEHKASPGDLSSLRRWYSGWLEFDSTWYVYIAEHGYDAAQEQAFDQGQQSAIAYFPAYPLTVRSVAAVFTGDDYPAAAMLVTFLCGLAVALLFWLWCGQRLAAKSRRTAIVLLLVYPYAWFLFGSGYSDALFLAATVGAFVLVDHDHLVLGGLAGFVATAARPTGTAVLVGLVAVVLQRRGVVVHDDNGWSLHRDRLRPRDAGVLVAVGGLASYMYFCYTQFDDAVAFATVQKAPGWDQPAGVHTWFKIAFFGQLIHGSPAFSIRLVAQAVLTVAFLAGSVLVLRRFGWGYAVYAIAVVLLPAIGTGDFQGMGRYLLASFPVFAAVGDWLAAPHRRTLQHSAVIVSAIALLALTSLFGRGYYLT